MVEPNANVTPLDSRERGHELSDVAVRPLLWFLAGLTALLIVVAAIVAGVFAVFLAEAKRTNAPAIDEQAAEQTLEGPRLQASPQHDLEELRRRDAQRLATLQWVDREAGVARIPIDQAMALVVEQGMPQWPQVDVAAPPDSATTSADAGGSPE